MKPKVVVIGGGPAGYESALSCADAGFDITLAERNTLGGTCVNTGCIPTRIYLQAIKSAEYLRHLNQDGAENLCGRNLRDFAAAKISSLSYGIRYLLEKKKVKILSAEAVSIEPGEVILSNGERIRADYIIIASGSVSYIPQGVQYQKLYSPESLLNLSELPGSLQIVGAGILGTELAVILQALGVQVTLYEKESQLLPGWDEDIGRVLAGNLMGRGIKLVTESERQNFDNAVFCCGRVPVLPEIHIPENQRDSLFIIGDAEGKYLTADMAAAQGRAMGHRLAEVEAGKSDGKNTETGECKTGTSKGRRFDTADIKEAGVQCVYTPLEAAMTGVLCGEDEDMTESYYSADMAPSGMIFDTEGTVVKVVMNRKTHVLKGFHTASALASEIIQKGQLAVSAGMTAEEFLRIIPPHPTEGELLREAVKRLL